MENKLFYSCPIIASYMSKYFGVKFSKGIEPFTVHVLDEGINTAREFHIDCYDHKKIYIHLDSLPIFEIKKGDLVKDLDNEYQNVWEDHKGLGIDTSYGTAAPLGCEIIQRNGKQFFTPEV